MPGGAKNRLLVVIPTLRGGGAERAATNLLRVFPRLAPDLEIILVLFGKENDVTLPASITVRYLDLHSGESLFAAVRRFFQVLSRLAAILQELRPCTILCFLDYTNIVTLLAKLLAGAGCRIAISVRTRPSAQTRLYAADYREKVVGYLISYLYNRADMIISVTKDAADDLVQNFKIRDDMIKVIHNPVDLHHVGIRAGEDVTEPVFQMNEPIILTVGRLAREKGFASLLQAFALVRRNMPAKLVMIGEGPERSNLEGLCSELGIEEDVHFLGYQENPYKYMQRATILALSSRYEGFVNVVAEAMACSLPVVATRCFTDIEEIVQDGESGLLVAVDDMQGLADGMSRLICDKELRMKFATAGKSYVQLLAVETIATRYLEVMGLGPVASGMNNVRN